MIKKPYKTVLQLELTPRSLFRMHRKIKEAQQYLMIDVASQLLARQFEPSDGHLFEAYIGPAQSTNQYIVHFAYSGLKVGTFVMDMQAFKVAFFPCDKDEFLEPAKNEDGTNIPFKTRHFDLTHI